MMIPPKLQQGDEIRIIAPSRSGAILGPQNTALAIQKLEQQGFKISFSKNFKEENFFTSSSIASRVADIHEAFADKKVKAIFTAIGGFNANQLLQYLDYDLIKQNPKILCGYSDITVLSNAITAKTGLITYSGLHFSTWAMQKEFEYNLEYFQKCLVNQESFSIASSKTWSADAWYLDQENRNITDNEGFWILNEGEVEGKIFVGNLCTFNLLHGTEYMPDLSDAIIFIEEENIVGEYFVQEFDRDLQSLIHQSNFDKVRGLVIGRFQKNTRMSLEILQTILANKAELKHLPILANVDFGHTNPMITFPIGGTAKLSIKKDQVNFKILQH